MLPEELTEIDGFPDSFGRSDAINLNLVYVCFHSENSLRKSLEFLFRSGDCAFINRIVVVNNSQNDAIEIEALCMEYGIVFVQSKVNVGYGSGCNFGFEYTDARAVAFLNPDVLITSESLRLLAGVLYGSMELVAVGPEIYDGKRRRRIKRASVAEPNRKRSRNWKRLDSYPVQFIPGCALVVESDAFRKVGGFDAGFFLYFEDDDLCIRLGQLGELRRVETAVALHRHGNSSTDRSSYRQVLGWHLGFSMSRALRKHRGEVGRFIAAYRLILRTLSPLNLLSQRYRRKTVAYVMGGRHALMSQSLPTAPNSIDHLPGLKRIKTETVRSAA